MSRSPRNRDGREVRLTQPTTKIVCSGEGLTAHPARLVGNLGWKRDDINPQDPRWTPAGPVLMGSTGLIAAGGTLMDCRLCPERVFLQPFELSSLVQILTAECVSRMRLQDVAGKITPQ